MKIKLFTHVNNSKSTLTLKTKDGPSIKHFLENALTSLKVIQEGFAVLSVFRKGEIFLQLNSEGLFTVGSQEVLSELESQLLLNSRDSMAIKQKEQFVTTG